MKEIELTPAVLVNIACIMMIACDGEIEDSEIMKLHNINPSEDKADIKEALKIYQEVDKETVLEACGELLTEEQQKFLFINLVDIMMRNNGGWGADESELIEEFSDAIDVDVDIDAIFDTLQFKNDKTVF